MITAMVLSPAVDKIYYLEQFTAGKLYRANHVVTSAGGKGINVARVAVTLGNKVGAIGFKAGKTGDWLEAKLVEIGVETSFIEVQGESRTNSNIIDRMNKTETEILEVGPVISIQNQEDFFIGFKTILKDTKVLVCSGGLPEGIPVDFYRTLIEYARPLGIKILLDSNGRILEEGLKGRPYLVKPNLRELSKFAGRELKGVEEIREACLPIIALGVEVVVASLGKEGALLVSKDKTLFAHGPQIEVMNTIGSGDSMVAGLATGILNGNSCEDMLKLGMACAYANTQFEDIGSVNMELVQKFRGEIILEAL